MIIASIVFFGVLGLLYLFALCRAAARPLPQPSSGEPEYRTNEDTVFHVCVPAPDRVHEVVRYYTGQDE